MLLQCLHHIFQGKTLPLYHACFFHNISAIIDKELRKQQSYPWPFPDVFPLVSYHEYFFSSQDVYPMFTLEKFGNAPCGTSRTGGPA